MLAVAVSYDNEFVEVSVDLGNQIAALRQYRDALTQTYGDLSLQKISLMMKHQDNSSVQARMDEIKVERDKVVFEIDELNARMHSHLKACLIRH